MEEEREAFPLVEESFLLESEKEVEVLSVVCKGDDGEGEKVKEDK